MNREIKFRGWDTLKNRWATTSPAIMGKEDEPVFELKYTEEIILMQYIGLEDKNGKEIYEGDILKCVMTKEYQEEENKIYLCNEVYFNKKELRYEIKNEYLPLTWGGYESIEVIGNIYQNPELIKEE